ASVIGYLDLVLEGGAGPLSESQRSFLGTAARNAEVLLGMIDANRFAHALGADIARSPGSH
nr:hypothetical protein [Micromonospora sp. DSM 115978]